MRHPVRKFLSILLVLVIVNGTIPATELMAMPEEATEAYEDSMILDGETGIRGAYAASVKEDTSAEAAAAATEDDYAEAGAAAKEDSTEASAAADESDISAGNQAVRDELKESEEALSKADEESDSAEALSEGDAALEELIASSSGDLPASYDLRNYGLVTPVKNQLPWNTCWAFATTAAMETSILTAMGSTYEETGLDLSERHLAWLVAHPLPEGICDSQTGEGYYRINGETESKDIYLSSSTIHGAASIWASGFALVPEVDYPYRGNAAILEKDVLLYRRDEWIEEEKNSLRIEYANEIRRGWVTEEDIEIWAEEDYEAQLAQCDTYDFYSSLDDWSLDPYYGASDFTLSDYNIFAYTKYSSEQGISIDTDVIECIKRELMAGRALAFEFYEGSDALNKETWAFYKNTSGASNHAACIVGWDDNYSAENFRNKAPGDGAWLIKDSYGSETDAIPDGLIAQDGTTRTANGGENGITDKEGRHTGYCWISYYDKSIHELASFTFRDFPNNDLTDALQYDYVPVDESVKAIESSSESSIASIYPIDHDLCITAIGTRTYVNFSPDIGDYDVKVDLYKLDEGSTEPVSGNRIGGKESHFSYAGYHRIELDEPVSLSEGDRLGVVVTILHDDGNGNSYYCCPASSYRTKQQRSYGFEDYAEVNVNPGESFIRIGSDDGETSGWIDIAGPMGEDIWKTVAHELDIDGYDGQSLADYLNLDNFCIKAFTEPKSEEPDDTEYKIAKYNESAAKPALVQAEDQTEEQLSTYFGAIETVTVNGTEYNNKETPVILTEDVTDENGNVTVPAGTIDLNVESDGKKIFDGGEYELTVKATEHDEYTFKLVAPTITMGGDQVIGTDRLEADQIGLTTDGNPAYLRAVKVDGEALTVPSDYEAMGPEDNLSVLFTKEFQKTLKIGEHKIEVVYANGTDTTKLTVKDTNVAVTGVKLNKTSAKLLKGKTLQLKATVTPADATDKTVTWQSSNSAVAAVDKNGKVTAKKTGSAKITVTTKDGKKTAVCTVKVYERIPVYRFYNRKTGDHMYTISEAECESLVKAGWKAEGIACHVPKSSSKPVYRLYNKSNGDHMFTISIDERKAMIGAGWVYEGIGFYSDTDKTVPIYRLYNPNAKSGYHFFTGSKSERDGLIKLGWRDERIGFYGN